jgi:hypothetical protein
MTTHAKFLVLFDDTLRAVLFDAQQRLLGEVIEEDGFIVATMLQSAREFDGPRSALLGAVVPPPSPLQPVRCFQLN